jgi:hypothetical protein
MLSSSEGIELNRYEDRKLVITRLTHIQNLAKEKRFDEIQTLLKEKYV